MTTLYRLSGGGNDFLALVEPEAVPDAKTIRAWCTRGLSLGADGLFALHREEGAVRMDYFNADGGAADLCVNATRCAARLAAHLGWIESETTIRTGAGEIRAAIPTQSTVTLQLRRPEEAPQPHRLHARGRDWEGRLISVGVPHLVLDWQDPIADAPVDRVGPPLRAHAELGPAGANVNFVRVVNRHQLEIRSFERGVEAETLACGTGILAATAVGLTRDLLELPVDALTRGGFTMTVADGDDHAHWRMTGDARLLARLELFDTATELPPATGWGRSME
jgi:diaminopimelate epimerase